MISLFLKPYSNRPIKVRTENLSSTCNAILFLRTLIHKLKDLNL